MTRRTHPYPHPYPQVYPHTHVHTQTPHTHTHTIHHYATRRHGQRHKSKTAASYTLPQSQSRVQSAHLHDCARTTNTARGPDAHAHNAATTATTHSPRHTHYLHIQIPQWFTLPWCSGNNYTRHCAKLPQPHSTAIDTTTKASHKHWHT